MDLNEYVNETYLKADELKTSKIWSIKEVTSEQDKEDPEKFNIVLMVVFAENTRKFQLNQTNLKRLIDIFGNDSDNLIDKKIVLKIVETEYKGKTANGIRVDEDETRKNNSML